MYKIKIENLETGKVEADEVADCIIAATNIPDENRTHYVAAISGAYRSDIKRCCHGVRVLCKRVKSSI